MRRRLAIAVGMAGVTGLVVLGAVVIGDGVDTVTSGGLPSSGISVRPAETTATTATPPASSVTTAPSTTTTTLPGTTTTRRPVTTTTRRPVTTTTRPPAPPTTTTTAATGPGSVLRRGATGAEVTLLQQRLTELGYWLTAVDGAFGDATFHAVVALQKTAGLRRDGVVDDATRGALDSAVRPQARSTAGRVVEIDLARQILYLVQDGRVEHIFDTSTGRPGLATPTGQFRIHHQIDTADYHGQYRPKQFYAPRDLAIHGYSSVPATPYSHGCARVTLRAMDWLWANGRIPVGTPVMIF